MRSLTSLVAATLASMLMASVLLVTIVMPAEFGIDITGVGRALGISGLSPAESGALKPGGTAFALDRRTLRLAPFESLEIKFEMDAGQSLVFDWQANAEVLYDFHSEPAGAAPGTAEGFERARLNAAQGVYTAPFPGVHGWFFENRNEGDVTIDLTTAGFYAAVLEYRDGRVVTLPPTTPATPSEFD